MVRERQLRQPRSQPDAVQQRIEQFFRRWNWTGARPEYLDRVRQRVGATPEERLRWVLQISQPDYLTKLRPEEHPRLGDDLRACAYLALQPSGGGYRIGLDAMTTKDLQGYLAAIDSGLRGVLSTPSRPWPFTAEPLLGMRDGDFVIRFAGDERAGILGGVAHLVVEVGNLLKACVECQTPFVADRRQSRYCSAKCIDRKWNRGRKEESRG